MHHNMHHNRVAFCLQCNYFRTIALVYKRSENMQ